MSVEIPMVNVERQESGNHEIVDTEDDEILYTFYHFIAIQQLRENILLFVNTAENEAMRNNINKTYFEDRYNIYNVMVYTSGYDELPDAIKEMADDMKKENKTRCNFITKNFKDSSEMDDYILMLEKIHRESRNKIIKKNDEPREPDNVSTNETNETNN